ncbi:MAG: NAD-dependent epimerase/dehydratase family protein [Solirubrobacteraceae bacterium]
MPAARSSSKETASRSAATKPPARGKPARSASRSPSAKLTVAVTGPTGDIGRSLLRALERSREVGRIEAMARSPFDPAEAGLKKTKYRQADVLDPDAVAEVVAEADVVVHLAFVIMGDLEETTTVNLEGSRNVFRAAITAGAKRLVYASSVAAYGFHGDRPELLTEEIETRGSKRHYYSAQKAELETAMWELLEGAQTDAYVFRPCIVAGPDALTLLESIPYIQLTDRMPAAIVRALEFMPALKPVIPDPGVPFQLVHHDDVATAMRAAVLGRGEPGVYNLAGPGSITMSDLASALGWYSIPIPDLAVGAAAELVARLPFVPAEAQWIESVRHPVLMDTSRARTLLGWRPDHDAAQTLTSMVEAGRSARLIR